MRLDSITLEGFRNYKLSRAEFSPGVNVIFGDNAQGKTNLLEAISYISTGRSFRARREQELIRFGDEAAYITASGDDGQRPFKLEARLFGGARRRQLIRNGVKLKNLSELSGTLTSVLFCPEDLSLIKDGASVRRRFLDSALCQLRPRYAKALGDYNRALEHKSRILKDWRERPDMLDTLPDFDLRMARTGALVIYYRARFIKLLQKEAAATHLDFSGGREQLELSYKTVSTVSDPMAPPETLVAELTRHQESHREAEKASGSCLSGPHKDDLLSYIEGRELRSFGSQGQTRTAALSLKIAEREIFKNDSGQYPLLLLDDVLSELDAGRQDYVLNRIGSGQVFISCCGEKRLRELNSGRIFTVQNGTISAREVG